jgi:prepilin-type N-terminal cleavage/methylation domain-containing protein
MTFHRDRGFTLIELLVVIAIIGMLASVVLASLNGARQKGRDARRLSDIKEVQTSLELYYNDNNSYPTALSSLAPTYIAAAPADPSSGASYLYVAANGASSCGSAPCSSYVLGATLEGASNTALSGDIDTNPVTGSFSCTDPVYCVKP